MPGGMSTVGIGEAADDDVPRGAVPLAARTPQQIMVSPRDAAPTVMVLARPGHGLPQLPVSRRAMPTPVARRLDLMVQ